MSAMVTEQLMMVSASPHMRFFKSPISANEPDRAEHSAHGHHQIQVFLQIRHDEGKVGCGLLLSNSQGQQRNQRQANS